LILSALVPVMVYRTNETIGCTAFAVLMATLHMEMPDSSRRIDSDESWVEYEQLVKSVMDAATRKLLQKHSDQE
jgi:hypothetical protein